jgi:hypothetical protein
MPRFLAAAVLCAVLASGARAQDANPVAPRVVTAAIDNGKSQRFAARLLYPGDTVSSVVAKLDLGPPKIGRYRYFVVRQAGDNRQVLPVDWSGIADGERATDYPLEPGDCVYIQARLPMEPWSRSARLYAPMERLYDLVVAPFTTVQTVTGQKLQSSNDSR